MTDRQARLAQLTLAVIATACAAYVLLGCDAKHTVQDDITICRGICGARPIDDFSSGENWRNLSCRCGKLDPPPPSPCTDSGANLPW